MPAVHCHAWGARIYSCSRSCSCSPCNLPPPNSLQACAQNDMRAVRIRVQATDCSYPSSRIAQRNTAQHACVSTLRSSHHGLRSAIPMPWHPCTVMRTLWPSMPVRVRTVCAWCAHCVRTVCAWYAHGVRVVCAWCAHCVRMHPMHAPTDARNRRKDSPHHGHPRHTHRCAWPRLHELTGKVRHTTANPRHTHRCAWPRLHVLTGKSRHTTATRATHPVAHGHACMHSLEKFATPRSPRTTHTVAHSHACMHSLEKFATLRSPRATHPVAHGRACMHSLEKVATQDQLQAARGAAVATDCAQLCLHELKELGAHHADLVNQLQRRRVCQKNKGVGCGAAPHVLGKAAPNMHVDSAY
eukprot:284920-Chlamydomonas_euryale.AAC.12